MADEQSARRLQLDPNSEVFQKTWLELDRSERDRVTDKTPEGMQPIYSLRVTKARRATAIRQGNFLRFLTIEPDHDAAYGKK